MLCIVYLRNALMHTDTSRARASCDKQKMGIFDMSRPRASCELVFKAGISLVIRDHLGIPLHDVASCLLGFCVMCPTIVLPDRASRE